MKIVHLRSSVNWVPPGALGELIGLHLGNEGCELGEIKLAVFVDIGGVEVGVHLFHLGGAERFVGHEFFHLRISCVLLGLAGAGEPDCELLIAEGLDILLQGSGTYRHVDLNLGEAWDPWLRDVPVTGKILFEAREVRHAGFESLQGRVGGEDLVVTKLLSELDMFEKDEVSDARISTTEELFGAHVINHRFQIVHERLDGDRPVILSEAGIGSGDELLVGLCLECEPASALSGTDSEESRAELLANVLMDGKGLTNLEVVTNEVRKVGEVQANVSFIILPLIFSIVVDLMVILNSGIVEHVAGRVASGGATELPVAEGDLLFLRAVSLLGDSRW